jgi:very-short-patch-repair endonuclease
MWLFNLCNNIVRLQDKILKRRRFMPSKKASSKGERAVVAALEKHGIRYEMQYALGYYIHVDFAVYYNGKLHLIEYDGRQHYHSVKYFGGRWRFFLQRFRDGLENMECRDRHVPLLRIRYDVPHEQIEDIVLQFLEKETV